MPGLTLRLVVGLGNPGPEYAQTRHNAGFWLVDELAARHGGQWKADRRLNAETTRVSIADRELWLIKPMAFMNRSGGPVRSFCDYLKVGAGEVLVAHDELDLPVGAVRLKLAGGAGGHNGLRDLITHLGADFWRFRLGIAHPGHRDEVVDYVLRRAPREEQEAILSAIARAADEIPRLLTEGADKVMNRLHTQPSAAGEG
ncbi:MAG: aminoacyl-tRNA hydrolase [Steroidobacteraceae bacterium]